MIRLIGMDDAGLEIFMADATSDLRHDHRKHGLC